MVTEARLLLLIEIILFFMYFYTDYSIIPGYRMLYNMFLITIGCLTIISCLTITDLIIKTGYYITLVFFNIISFII